MPFRRLSAFLLLASAAAAPWIAGANNTLSLGGWWLALPLFAAFAALLCDGLQTKTVPRVKWPAWAATLVILGMLAWWLATPAPAFATPFAAEHWQFLEDKYPAVILQWPRSARLIFFSAAVLSFLTSLELGRAENFRRQLRTVIGLSGLILALYALGIRWLGWATPPWIKLAADTERFNVWFFHHNGPGGGLILAWPLWWFQTRSNRSWRSLPVIVALLFLAGAALSLWHSYSPFAVIAGLLLLGFFWHAFAAKTSAWPWVVRGTIVALFAGIFTWQAWTIVQLQRTFPDGWTSAEQTLQDAPVRDAALKVAAKRRGDRLVTSAAPPRAAAWLTAVRMAKDYPLVGLGPGGWVTHAVLYSHDPLVNTFHQHRQFAHHDLLQTAAEWGGLGALAWLVIWIGALWLATRPDASGAFREIDVVLSLVGIALHSMVHFPLQNPALLLWATLLLGLAWSSGETRDSTPRSSDRST